MKKYKKVLSPPINNKPLLSDFPGKNKSRNKDSKESTKSKKSSYLQEKGRKRRREYSFPSSANSDSHSDLDSNLEAYRTKDLEKVQSQTRTDGFRLRLIFNPKFIRLL